MAARSRSLVGAVRVKSALRERLFAHLMRLDPGYTEGEPYLGCYLRQMALSTLVPLLIAAYLLALGRTFDQQQKISDLGTKLSRMQRRMASVTGLQGTLHDLTTNLAVWTTLTLILAKPLGALEESRYAPR